MSIDSAFDRIEVIFHSNTDRAAVDDFLSRLRSVPFRQFMNISPHYYGTPTLPTLASVETDVSIKLFNGIFKSHLILKYPNPLVGKSVQTLTSVLNLWSRAIFRTIPADYDLVYAVPGQVSESDELIPCPAYIITSNGAAQMLGIGLDRLVISAYELAFD